MSEEIDALKHRIAQLEGALFEIRSWNRLQNTLPEAATMPHPHGWNAQLKADEETLDDRSGRNLLEYWRQVRTICEDVGLLVDQDGSPVWEPVTPPKE